VSLDSVRVSQQESLAIGQRGEARQLGHAVAVAAPTMEGDHERRRCMFIQARRDVQRISALVLTDDDSPADAGRVNGAAAQENQEDRCQMPLCTHAHLLR
jgi:hypothetical protein